MTKKADTANTAETFNNPFNNKLLYPRHWPSWLGMSILWLVTRLPWHWQMQLGRQFGLLMHACLRERRRICQINMQLAFPELSEAQQKARAKAHFVSLGQGILETALSWWGRESLLKPLSQLEGLDYLRDALQDGGVILVSAHFTSLEIGGRIMAPHMPIHAVYRPHQNPVIEYFSAKLRQKRYAKTIRRENVRGMLQSLRQGHALWYAQDQHFGHKNRVFVPFFDVMTATNPATTRISSLGKAKVVPCFTVRTANGYLLRFLPALENFPGESVEEDTRRINQLIEAQVREFPEQYLWTHRRFKLAPDGSNRYRQKHPA